MDSAIQTAFDRAQHMVFLTGAGVSTPSGIPDYRSKAGLYTGHQNAEYYLSQTCFTREPDVFYDYMKTNLYYPEARPNVIHDKQAALTNQGRAAIVTQNIDNLYHVAGATHLVEFHGNLYDVYCAACHQRFPWQDYLVDPRHAMDHGWLRPNIVLYGEGLDPETVNRGVQAVAKADLIVIVGTSMRVYPFAGLLDYRSPAAKIIVVNQERLDLPVPYTMVQTNAEEFFDDLTV
ncbi:NAD-dependent protein deacylase [Levilactobacillus bambusae]|uniref:protein acetyllysine N-acetyltransferase n=1 Tax=Levilactobacillus bambusae TaxID=2024736 RepID=A0A2V1MW74_9LACO|nr:NAD-dependent protein deacylase [Levilactobacillus bambusae]PWF99336.1 NAD-dependent protein deacylase [Levilactobacillus bambusae]